MINLGKLSKTGKEVILEEKENGCIECISHCKDNYGYTRIKIDKKHQRLFRYIYEQKYGKIPKGMVIRHTCDNTSCCNIEHLLIGTQKDNVRDMIERGRDKFHEPKHNLRGTKNGSNKLTENQVINIYMSKLTNKELANKYNVSTTLISYIKSGKCWSWLNKNLAR